MDYPIILPYGNYFQVAQPLTQINWVGGEENTAEFIPASGDKLSVCLICRKRKFNIVNATIEDNILTYEINGNLPIGVWSIEVKVLQEDGTRLRSFQEDKIKITTTNEDAGISGDEFSATAYTLDSVILLSVRGITVEGDFINYPDEEDLTTVITDAGAGQGVLKFKDRTPVYDDDDNLLSKGYVILRSTDTLANQLTQEDTIYEVRYDFDLDGDTLTIPDGCVLKCNGGRFSNGILELNNCSIESTYPIFYSDIVVYGKTSTEASPEWFEGSDADKIEKCIEFFGSIRLGARDYLIDRPIEIQHSFAIRGCAIPSNFGAYVSHEKDDYSPSRLIPINAEVGTLLSIDSPRERFVSGLISGVSFIALNYESDINVRGLVNGITISTPGGPSRPFVIENCNFARLNKAIHVYDNGSSSNGTNLCNLSIKGCNISINKEGIHIEGNHAIMHLDVTSNVIEQNTDYGIYMGDNTISYGSFYGYGRILNNLLEGQANPIYAEVERCNLVIEGNYFEKTTVNPVIEIKGKQLAPRFNKVTIKNNTVSTNLPNGGIHYKLSRVTIEELNISGGNSVFLNYCIINNIIDTATITQLHRCAWKNNGTSKKEPIAKFDFVPNYIYNDKICLINSTSNISSAITLDSPLQAGTYVLVWLSDTTDNVGLTIGSNTISMGDSFALNSMLYRASSFTIDEDIPAGTNITVSFNKNNETGNTGLKSTVYLFALATGFYGLPFIDIDKTKTPDYDNIINLPLGYSCYRKDLDKNAIFGLKPYSATNFGQVKADTTYVLKYAFVDNTFETQKLYGIIINNIINTTNYPASRSIDITFCKDENNLEDAITIQIVKASGSAANSTAWSERFYAPDSTIYTKVRIGTMYTGYSSFYSKKYDESWVDEDGAIAGVARRGTTANRPTSESIYAGFQYFDSSLSPKRTIVWNGSDWTELDGTTLS